MKTENNENKNETQDNFPRLEFASGVGDSWKYDLVVSDGYRFSIHKDDVPHVRYSIYDHTGHFHGVQPSLEEVLRWGVRR